MWSKSCCLYAQLRIFNLFKLIGYTISLLMHAHRSFHVTTQLFVNATKQKLLIIVRKKIFIRARKNIHSRIKNVRSRKKCSFAKKNVHSQMKIFICAKKSIYALTKKAHKNHAHSIYNAIFDSDGCVFSFIHSTDLNI